MLSAIDDQVTLRARALKALNTLLLIWLGLTALASVLGTDIAKTAYAFQVAYPIVRLIATVALMSLPMGLLWFGLISYRTGGIRWKAIACAGTGLMLCTLSVIAAFAWWDVEKRSLQTISAPLFTSVNIADVANMPNTPADKRAELTLLFARSKYIQSGEVVEYMRPDSTWQLFAPMPKDLLERNRKIQAVESFRLSIALCIAWIIYAMTGAAGALIAGLKWKIPASNN